MMVERICGGVFDFDEIRNKEQGTSHKEKEAKDKLQETKGYADTYLFRMSTDRSNIIIAAAPKINATLILLITFATFSCLM